MTDNSSGLNKENEQEENYLYFDDVLPIFLKFRSFPVEPKTEYEIKIINVKKQYYIQGNKKKELAEWYLEFIEVETDKFLIEEDSFNFSVIPTMYLDTPPSSMAEIDRNLLIVRKYIDNLSFSSNNSKNKQQQQQQQQQQESVSSSQITTPTPVSPSLQTPRQHNTVIYNKLVNQLISKVHTLIDIFIKESLCILYYDLSKLTDQFKIDIYLSQPLVIVPNSSNNSNGEVKIYNTMTVDSSLDIKEFLNNSSKIIKRLQRKQQQLQSQQSDGLINSQDLNSYIELVKDIEHLNTMKLYDKEFFQMDHSILSADNPVVGVTGLVVNRLHRLENELKTIQQHWNVTTINSHNQHYNAFNRR